MGCWRCTTGEGFLPVVFLQAHKICQQSQHLTVRCVGTPQNLLSATAFTSTRRLLFLCWEKRSSFFNFQTVTGAPFLYRLWHHVKTKPEFVRGCGQTDGTGVRPGFSPCSACAGERHPWHGWDLGGRRPVPPVPG